MADHAANDDLTSRERANALPVAAIDVADPALFQADQHWPYFERLRREDPVHFAVSQAYGPYWSITRYQDILEVDADHEAFSSSHGITIVDPIGEFRLPMFIATDPPIHEAQRKVVAPIFSPPNLARMESLIRARAAAILDELPVGETFDWVDRVSIELTTQMLATLFDFPFDQRRKLAYWSDVATAVPGTPKAPTVEFKHEQLMGCLTAFTSLWNERVNAPPSGDLISMLAHGEATRNMDQLEYLGNIVLLIVGGNDTTRNTLSGSILALSQNPGEYAKLRARPELIPSMVAETIRWQTPLAHMRRTAARDVEFHGKTIRAGDKVIMWYVSGNRDETVIEAPNDFRIDRERPRQHLSFGFGIHRCLGNRLAEMQLRVVWEEILKRHPVIEVVAEPERVFSTFVRGYESLATRIAA
jgi:cytochrome P450